MKRERLVRLAQNIGGCLTLWAIAYAYLLWAWQARPSIDLFEQAFVTITLVGSGIGSLVANWKGAVCGLFTVPALSLIMAVLSNLQQIFPPR